jgi:hypothetical protein
MQTNSSYLKPTGDFLSAVHLSNVAPAIDVTVANGMSLVFVVDDEVSVRESLELLMGAEGWRAGHESRRLRLPDEAAQE